MSHQREETVEEYLNRGGKITVLPPAPNGTAIGAGLYEPAASPMSEPEMIQTVSWRELYEDVDPEREDKSYWIKLNKKLDKMLKELDKKK